MKISGSDSAEGPIAIVQCAKCERTFSAAIDTSGMSPMYATTARLFLRSNPFRVEIPGVKALCENCEKK